MEDTFKTINIIDSRIGDITSELSYGVQTSASNVTAQSFAANSNSSSSVSFNINVPSEQIVVDRHVTMSATINLQLTATVATAAGSVPLQYGINSAVQAFPLNKLFSTSQVTINNAQIQTNEMDIIDMLLLMNDDKNMSELNSSTATMPDKTYLNYANATQTNNNPLAGYTSAAGGSTNYAPLTRGSYSVKMWTAQIAADGSYAGTTTTAAADGAVIYVWLSITVTEPLLGLPCFTYSESDYQNQGIVGVNTMSFIFNINNLTRVFSTAAPGFVVSAQSAIPAAAAAAAFPAPQTLLTDPRLNFIFLSTQSTQIVPSKNVIPLLQFPRYLSQPSTTQIPAATAQALAAGRIIVPGVLSSQPSPNYALNQLPDQIWIGVRVPMSQQTIQNSASFFPITSISINLANQSGLLSSFTQAQLYDMSRKAGLNLNFTEFAGIATTFGTNGSIVSIPTVGGFLVIPIDQLSLPPYLAGGSIGQYNLQFNVSFQNYSESAQNYEIVLCTVNSGIMVTQTGSSQIFSGMLTKEMVLDTVEKSKASPMMSETYNRIVGGKLAHRGAILHPHHLRKHLSHKPHLQGGIAEATSMLGGISAPGSVGGKRHHSKLKKHLHSREV
jgi:hypothetical protein